MFGIDAEAPGDALPGAEQIYKDRKLGLGAVRFDRRFEQQGGAVRPQHTPMDFGDLVNDGYLLPNSDKPTLSFKMGYKTAQIAERWLVAAQHSRLRSSPHATQRRSA